ncbi:MAG: MBL fold metallo-hydrolase [Proteobacteria bacterium]|nr:MBL fold metallo-hydrolase [Pseudomonadota bacterium]
MIIKTLSVAPFGTNCYVLACEKTGEAIVIDPGGDAEKILRISDKEEFVLKYIINTHAHFDHVGAVNEIKKAKNVPFLLHQADEVYLRPESLKAMGMHDMEPPIIDEYIDPGKTYSFGETSFSVLETPGHSPGGVCFLFQRDVFVGDTLFAGSIGRTDFPGGSMETLMESIKNKLMPLDDDIIVHCGHMDPTTIGTEKKFNPFKQYW